MDKSLTAFVELIKQSESIAVLTGAGISTSAGIPDFRGPKGLYVTRQYDPEKVFDINYFYHDPKPFFAFARDFLTLENKIRPTYAHRFLTHLEKEGKIKGIVTQNIDSLHQIAGSKNVYEMHGSFWQSHCLKCSKEFSFDQMKKKLGEEEIPKCSCGGVIKPDIVFFGENVKYYSESVALAERVDLFLVVGTSCVVYPAASLPHYVRGQIVIVNQSKVSLPLANIALAIEHDIDETFTSIVQRLGYKI